MRRLERWATSWVKCLVLWVRSQSGCEAMAESRTGTSAAWRIRGGLGNGGGGGGGGTIWGGVGVGEEVICFGGREALGVEQEIVLDFIADDLGQEQFADAGGAEREDGFVEAEWRDHAGG